MTAERLSATAKDYPSYAVVGMFSEQVSGGFVQHVAILRAAQKLSFGVADVKIWHMGPPLIVGQKSIEAATGDSACLTVHVAGVAELDADDCEGIQTWLSDVEKEERPYGGLRANCRQYIVKPHMDWERARETNRRLYRKFSCAGFVIECYASVGINLVTLPEDAQPEMDLQTVLRTYPDAHREGLRRQFGILGDGPWRILMAGYVLHAMDRESVRAGAHTPTSAAEAYFTGSKIKTD